MKKILFLILLLVPLFLQAQFHGNNYRGSYSFFGIQLTNLLHSGSEGILFVNSAKGDSFNLWADSAGRPHIASGNVFRGTKFLIEVNGLLDTLSYSSSLEVDPIFVASVAHKITAADTAKWTVARTLSDTSSVSASKNFVAGKYATLNNLKYVGIANYSAGHTLTLADAGKYIVMNKSSADSLMIPSNATLPLPIGYTITFTELGTGALTVYINTDTLYSEGSKVELNAQYSDATLIKIASTTWKLMGSLK